jgi:hypothetical protein
MALYLSSTTLAETVERLGTSRAKSSLCDFLIIKRAMTQDDGTVTLSLNDQTYTDAVRTLAAVSTVAGEERLPPYFNPFGTRHESTQGWRTAKYPSNGPPDTVNGPGWKRLIEVLSEKPRRVRFTEDYLEHLSQVIVRGGGPTRSDSWPLLEDCAIWLHRRRSVPDGEAQDEALLDRMVATFVAEIGLTDDERQLIFGGRQWT